MKQTDYVILGLLSEAPLTGYQIKKLVDVRFRFFWSESFGQIYPALKALAEQDLIREQEEGGDRRRSQRVYELAPEGLAAVKAWLAQPVERESYRLELLLKMYFSGLGDRAAITSHVRRFRQAHEEELALLDLFEEEVSSLEGHGEVLQVIRFGRKVNQAYLEWCREALDYLERRKQS